MSITSFNTLYVEELYLEGDPFTVANFKGLPGDMPTIDETAVPGDDGVDWTPLYDFKLITSPAAGEFAVWNLPDPLADDIRYPIPDKDPVEYEKYSKTMMFVIPDSTWNAGAQVTISDHNNVFLGKFYEATQVMKFVNANGNWKIC
jgi:hypothetical protein